MSDAPRPVVQLRHEFSMVSAKNEVAATATVERMNSALWLSNIWTHHDYRRQGYATQIIHAVLAQFGDVPLWIHVYPYANRPMSDEALVAWYGTFGFCSTVAPGVLYRPPVERS